MPAAEDSLLVEAGPAAAEGTAAEQSVVHKPNQLDPTKQQQQQQEQQQHLLGRQGQNAAGEGAAQGGYSRVKAAWTRRL
jgi:hypothetical protein